MNDNQLVLSDIFYDKNPYIKDLVQTIELDNKKSFIGKKIQHIVDIDTGELNAQEMLILGEKKYVDKTQFMKVYVNNVSNIFGLNKTEEKIFYNYIYQVMPKDTDWFIFDIQSCMTYTKLKSKTSIYRSLKNLIDKQLICKGNMKCKYFINPTVFFNGNRITLMQTYYMNDFKQLK